MQSPDLATIHVPLCGVFPFCTTAPRPGFLCFRGRFLVEAQLAVNPAAAVRGPKHVVTKGATPVLTPAETRALLDRIDTGTRVGLRDRALLSVLVYSFARVSAAVGTRRQDYFRQELRGWLRLHEKGGKRHDVPAHHWAEEAVEAYLRRRRRHRGREGPAVSERRPGRPSERAAARAPGRAGHDQAAGGCRGAAGVDVLPHVSGDGHHGVPVERRDARARATDRRPLVAEDDEAVRPDGGHDHARRDRTHRDLERPGGRSGEGAGRPAFFRSPPAVERFLEVFAAAIAAGQRPAGQAPRPVDALSGARPTFALGRRAP